MRTFDCAYYDTGFGSAVGDRSRREFDPAVVRRELEIIAADLHCTAVRISGDDPDRLAVAAHAALDAGLRVWFSPFPMDRPPPLVITEFGCCTHRGAADAGGTGWTIVDFTAEPRALNGDYVRDEAGQVAYFTELMDVFEAEGVHGAFWFTFAGYEYPSAAGPRRDLDLASYGAVRVLDGGTGTAYPGLAGEPKEVFHAIAARFSR
ncbi:hypothetical protein [Amycolatopsis sp. cmx-4-61]|uniref:hypothetical protein n=1 Tax=Amycolatopsis sp. cmx-4-61 TaxID=2790937 RepID=UPI00397E68E0